MDEAAELRDVLRQDPISEDREIPNAGELGGLNPEFANSLTTKSARVEVLLEAEVRGGVRRGRAVFEKGAQGQGGGEARFRLVEWAEGWVEDELGVLTPAVPTVEGEKK